MIITVRHKSNFVCCEKKKMENTKLDSLDVKKCSNCYEIFEYKSQQDVGAVKIAVAKTVDKEKKTSTKKDKQIKMF